MLPIGLGKSVIGTEDTGLNCLYCNTKHSIHATIYGRYFSLVYIPVFPVGRKVTSTCTHCKQTLEKEEFIRRYGANTFDLIKFKFKFPKTYFSFLFIMAVLAPFIIYNDISSKKRDSGYIADPRPGDLYEIKLGWRSYTLYKVSRSTKDSIFFYPNKFEVNKERKLSDDEMLKHTSFDRENPIGFSKTELVKMRESKKVLGIERD